MRVLAQSVLKHSHQPVDSIQEERVWVRTHVLCMFECRVLFNRASFEFIMFYV